VALKGISDGTSGDEPSSGPRKGRTQAERRADAERRMLQAGMRLLAQKGFAGLTLNEVGEAAGYSRGLPAHYFGRKDELLTAMARYIVNRFTKGLRVPDSETGPEGLAGLIHVADHYLTGVTQDPTTMRALLIILTETTNHPDLFPAIITLNRTSVEAIARYIRVGQERGEIRSDIDASSHAVLILGQLRGVVAQWLIDPETINIDHMRAAFSQSLTRSLSA
jgi:AcrR family transcriptional regulator